MKYPKIISEIDGMKWAITPCALDGIYRALEYGFTSDDYAVFHQSDLTGGDSGSVIGKDGIITINGPIIPRSTAITNSSGIVSVDSLTEQFNKFESDPSVERIVFLIDSPGGGVTGISDFAALVKKSNKRTVAFIVGQASSAAYWIASATDRIISTDTGQAGSIGIVLTAQKDDDGSRKIISAQSPNKRADIETEEGREILQSLVNDIADVFVSTVADNRGVSVDTVLNDFGQGASVVAKRALSVGMIDEISTVHDFFRPTGSDNPDIAAQERQGSSEIQTLIFDKRNFSTKQAAQKWARDHDFKTLPVVEKEKTWHIRQNDPAKYQTFRTGKPIAPGVTPVFGILQRQGAYMNPAIAGERVAEMKLAEFLAENPAARAELDAIRAEAYEAGKTDLRRQHEKVAVYLRSDAYPDAVKTLAMRVISGESDFAALEGAAIVLDIQAQKEKSLLAQQESRELPETPVENQAVSTDGQLRTPADVAAFLAGLKGSGDEGVV